MTALHVPPGAGLFDLNGDGSYLSWGVLQISWANTLVVALMLIVFGLALVLPFPGPHPGPPEDGGDER